MYKLNGIFIKKKNDTEHFSWKERHFDAVIEVFNAL